MKCENVSQIQPGDRESLSQKTSFANLICYAPSGKYFARTRVGGKLIRQSLKTNALSAAKLKLADLGKNRRARGRELINLPVETQNICTAWKK